jgi:hypothetical protein
MSGRVRLLPGGWCVLICFTTLIVAAIPSAATAQTTAATRRADRLQPKWEISVQAGGAHPGIPQQGFPTPPPQSPLFTTVAGGLSRTIPTWFFANGGSVLNQAATQAQTARLTTFDVPVFLPSSNFKNSWMVGVRISRAMNPRYSIEGALDYSRSSLAIVDGVAAAADATVASYQVVWNALLASEPATFQNVDVTAMSIIDAQPAGHQVMATGSLIINILTRRRNTPYALIGAGVMTHGGSSPSVTLVGRIRTMLNGTAPVDETDTMTLRYDINPTVFTVTVGLGWKRMMGERWGVRGEVREQLSGNPVSNLVTATPSVLLTSAATQQGAGATTKFIAVQFSNIAGSTVVSSLADTMAGQQMLRTSGMENRFSFSGGIFWRF